MKSARIEQNLSRTLKLLLFVLIVGVLAEFASAEDPDYGNDPTTAFPIEPNGAYVEGILSSTSDQDWFWFTAIADGNYAITFYNPASTGKTITVYGLDDSGQLQQLASFTVQYGWGTDPRTESVVTPRAGTTWLRVSGSGGSYQVAVLSPVPVCGDTAHPYPVGDFDRNCIVDFNDFGTFAGSWLTDNRH